MTEEKIGELYLEIKSDSSKLKAELAALKDEVNKKGKEIEQKLSFKARFDNGIAKLKLSELQTYRKKLQAEFDKKVSLNVDAASLERTRQKIASVDSQLNGVGKSATSMGTKIAAGFLAMGAGAAIFRVLKESVTAFIEASKAAAGVEQAVKRTGQAAGFTADQLQALAAQLQKLTGIDDDEILKGVTKQLLTFTKISGESFKRAQVAVLDLNAVIKDGEVGGLTSQAIQLGKALENPIVGVGALSRAGVTFTAEQKKMIKGFIEQNDLLSAQNVILTEVEAKYGGQAEAMAKAQLGTKQFSAAWGDLQEGIGEFLTNAPGLTWLIDEMTKGFANWSKLFQGQAFFLRQLKVELENLRQTSSAITFDSLTNSTQEARDGLKKYNEEQLKINKAEWERLELLKKQSRDKDFHTEIEKQQVALNKLSQIQRGEIDAIDKMNKKVAETSVAWDNVGKTFDQIRDRIAELETMKGSLAPGVDDKEIKQFESDIERLKKQLGDEGGTSTKFFTDIPKNFSADAVAEFENLKFAVKGYVDFRNEQINLVYQNEIKKAKGNADAILQAEENKKLAIARLNFEENEYNKKLAENKIEDLKKNSVKEVEVEASTLSKKEQDLKNYYNKTKILSDDYFKFQIQRVQDEAKEIEQLTKDPVQAKQFELDSMKALEQEYFDWRMEQWIQQQGLMGDVTKIGLESISAAYDTMWQTLVDSSLSGTERAAAIFNTLKSVAVTALGDVVKAYIANWIKSAVIGDSFRAVELAKGIAMGTALAQAYAPAAAFASTMSFGGAAVAGGAALASTVGLAQLLAIPKFGSGTDGYQKVPEGFSNDNYPIMMKSGEDFRVRTPQQKSSDEKTMAGIENKLDILNANLIDKNFAPVISNSLSIDGRKLTTEIIAVINKMEREGRQIGNF